MSMILEQANTNLGSKELHKRHSVMIEGGKYPRSKVMDQLIFDRYLMEGLINLSQHRSSEFLLNMAATAGMWARGANLNGVYVDSKKTSKVFFGMVPLGNALAKIKEQCSNRHCLITVAVIVHNKDVRNLDDGIRAFTDAMDYVNNNIVFFHKNPLRHLE